ncbi:ABC transporter permease subunit [Natrarchaeobius sp. A-rgal3]|uniref:ABC transporter permease subunit n=1 Tax=Natrarchaeobius versutus TaxID=1679078 RepID=UPI00350ED93F
MIERAPSDTFIGETRRSVRTVLTVSKTELRRHGRSPRTVGTVLSVIGICTLLAFNIVRLREFRRSFMRTTNNFQISATEYDILYVFLARDPLIALFLVSFAVLVGANAIAGTRENGTGRTLQSLPFDRRGVFVGIVLSRVAVVAVVAAAVVGLTFGRAHQQGYAPSIRMLVLFLPVLVIHLAAFVSIGSALSTLRWRRGAIHSVALLVAIGLSTLYVPLSRLAPEAAVLAPRQAFYGLVASLHGGWNVLSGVSTRAAVAAHLVLLVAPFLYGLYRYERCDLTT